MRRIKAGDTFEFRGVILKTGDHIFFLSKIIGLPHVEACFMNVDENGNMNVFNTLLVSFCHSGNFKKSEVFGLKIIKPAIEAFMFQSRNKRLFYGQKAVTYINGLPFECQLIGAFDGTAIGWCKIINNFVSEDSTHFIPVMANKKEVKNVQLTGKH